MKNGEEGVGEGRQGKRIMLLFRSRKQEIATLTVHTH